jgi:lipoyl(octanoyl) transferase
MDAKVMVAFLLINLHSMPIQEIIYKDLGLMDYQQAWDLQESILKQMVNLKSDEATKSQTAHHLLFVEHPHVYTLGKSGKKENVLISDEEMHNQHIDFFQTNRGGDITYHGPGQLVGYPILDLEKIYTDIGKYLRSLEEVIILTLADFGLKGDRSTGETGVWLDPGVVGKERKICAMGVRCSRWVTMHGFALNVDVDMSYFGNIIPCGIVNKQVTSLAKELGESPSMDLVKSYVLKNFEKVFDLKVISEITR